MAFVNAKTGKQVKLNTGYLSNAVDYQTFVKQQEAKRKSAAPAPTAADVSNLDTSARPSTVSLQNQLRQAQADLDTDAIMRLNRQLKEERARQGKQTVGDRVSDTLSAVFGGSGGSFANLAGFASNLAQDPAADRRQISRLQESLKTGRTTDGKPITDAQRKTIQEAVSRLDASAKKKEAPDSFTNRAYQAADRMADTGAAFQESAKKGLGKVGSTVVDAAVSMGQSTLDAALGAGLNLAVPGVGMLPFAARSFGGAAQEARRSGADLDEQLKYGSAQAAKEYVTEKLFGLAVPQRMLGRSGAGSLDDAIETGIRKVTERLAKTPGGQKAVGGLMTWLAGGATEGLEEGIGSLIENTLINPNLRDWDPDNRTREQKFEDGLYDMLVGGVSGLMGVTNLGAYNVSPAVRVQNAAQEASGARLEAGKGTDTPAAQNAARAAQTGPENIFAQTADAIRKEGDAHVRGTLELMQRAAGMETGQQETAPGTGAVVADTSLFDKSVLNHFSTARKGLIEFAKKHFPASVVNAETGKTIGISRIGLDKFLSGNIPYEKYASGFHIPELIERAHKVGEANNYHPGTAESIPTFEYYDSPIQIDGKDYTAHIRVKNSLVGDKYYGHTVSEVEDIKIEPPTRSSSPKSSAVHLENTGGSIEPPARTSSLETPAVQPVNAIGGSMDSTIPQGADPVKPSGTDGLGAADAGSLNSDYDRLQAQSSRFHPEGENAARPVDVPVQDFEGRNVSKAASTIMGAQILDDADVASLEQMVADGAFSFDTIHDKDALKKAQDTVRVIGFDRALEHYIQAAQANTATKDNTVLGQVLMLEAARGGNRNALAEIAALHARTSTNIAQAMQAQRILRQLGPEARLYALQKSVNELAEKYGVDIELDQTALDGFMNAENEEARQTAEAALVQSAAAQLPTTFRAKYDAVRYLAMLGNPKTHIRNIIGNLAFQIPATAKNRLGALAERGAQVLGADVERTKSLTGVNPFGPLAKEARADWANAKPFLEGSKYSEGKVTAGTIEREAKPFQDSNALGKAVGWAADKNGALLEAEDNLFKQWIYSQSLAGYLKANGVKSISEASPDLLNRARNYAAQEALRNTFNDKNEFSDFVASAGKFSNSKNPFAKGFGYAVEGVLPFKRTPANVLARAVEYSPLGSGVDIYNFFRDAKAGKMDQETVLKHLDRQAAALSGSALLAAGFLASGMISGGEDPDEDQRRFDDLTGHQSYALELDNGKSITLDWLAPSAIPFFMGVELAHAMQDRGLTPEEALNVLKGIGEPMLEMSMLQGLNDVFEDAAYAQQHGGSVPAALAVNAATNYLTQAVPTLFGQFERSAEGRRMTTYGDKNNPLFQDVQFFLGKLSQKVPGWDYNQIPYLDAWGREEESGDPVERVFNNFFNPAYVSQVQVDQVERELQRVKDATGDGGVFPSRAARYFTVNKERKDLTAEEYQTYAKKRGQTSMEVLRSMLESPGYQNLSDEKKAEAISDAYSYADAVGKMEISDYRPGDGTVAAGALKTMLPPAGYILYRMNRDRDGDGKVTNLESTQTLQELPGLSDQQRGEAWAAMNAQTNPARNPFSGALAEQGLTPEEAAAAWGIYGRSGTKEEPYTKSDKKRDLREELDLTTQEVNRLWNLMVKALEK